MNSTISAFASIRKVDEEKRIVWGRLTQEAIDKSGEIMDYATSKPEFEKWRDETLEATGGSSMGAGRVNHCADKPGVGKIVSMTFLDDEKAIDIGYKVVDDGEWAKTLEGVYTGFSVGGASFGRKWPDPVIKFKSPRTGKFVPATRFTITPMEASMADIPCLGAAKFFEIEKTDGSREVRHIKGADMSDVAKSLYTIGDFASVLQSVKYLQDRIASEAVHEGDGSPIPEALKEWLGGGAKLLSDYVGEEVAELTAPQFGSMHVADDDDFADLDEASEKAALAGDIEKGDYPGHPFRGNQHAGGRGAGAHHGASSTAHRASVRAHNGGSHSAAANYHKAAAKAHKAAGNVKMVKHHEAMAANHATHAAATGKAAGDDTMDVNKAFSAKLKGHLDKCNKAAQDFMDSHKAFTEAFGAGDDISVDKAADVGDIAKAVEVAVEKALAARQPIPAFRTPAEGAYRSANIRKSAGSEESDSPEINDLQKRAEAGDRAASMRLTRMKSTNNIDTLGA